MQRALSVDMSRLAFQEDDNVEPTSVVDAVQKEQNEPSSGRKQRQGASVAMAPAAAVTYQAEEQRLLSRKVRIDCWKHHSCHHVPTLAHDQFQWLDRSLRDQGRESSLGPDFSLSSTCVVSQVSYM